MALWNLALATLLAHSALGAAPSPRYNHSTIWTGNEMIVRGGNAADGARYHPGTQTWTPLSALNAPVAGYDHTVVWVGSEMIIWGGGDGTNRNTGGRYNLTANSWTATTINSAPALAVMETRNVSLQLTDPPVDQDRRNQNGRWCLADAGAWPYAQGQIHWALRQSRLEDDRRRQMSRHQPGTEVPGHF